MNETTLSRVLYKEVREALVEHCKTEEDRYRLLSPLEADLPNTFKDGIPFNESSSITFTSRLLTVLQKFYEELDVVLDELATIKPDQSPTIHDLRKRVQSHYQETRPHTIAQLTVPVTDASGNSIPTNQQILQTLDKLASEAPKVDDRRNNRLIVRMVWTLCLFGVGVVISALSNQMADAYVRSLGLGGIVAALVSSAIQYFIPIDLLSKPIEQIPLFLLNGLAWVGRVIGWFSAMLLGIWLGWLLWTTLGVGWGLALCAYALPLIYAIWAALPPEQADYRIQREGQADPRTKDLNEVRDRVRRYWLEGILRRGLEEQVGEMNINLEQNALIVDEKAGVFRVEVAGEGDIPRTSMSIYRLYRHFGYRFFILGEPGSGKTIMLLRLAADMLADKGRPYQLPLVLNLSSYRGGELRDWFIAEASTTYNVSPRTLADWHDRGLFALLLDGLDEIPDDAPHHYRAQCARAVNDYLATQDATADQKRASVVLCSRVAEHELMLQNNPDAQLHALTNRVTLQPLERAQINGIITEERYPALYATMQDDPILRGEDVAGVPFLLNAMVYAYGAAREVNELRLADGQSGIIARRNHLIRLYLLRRFTDPIPLPDKPEDLLRWLRWIAARTLATGTIFRVGVLDSTWLEGDDPRRTRAYPLVLWGLFGSLIGLPIALLLGYGMWHGGMTVSGWGIWAILWGWISSAWITAKWGEIVVLIVVLLVLIILPLYLLFVYGSYVIGLFPPWLWSNLLTPYFGKRVAWSLAQGNERLPTHLPAFIDQMQKRQVLRPLGEGYAFRHRYLEQHLVQGSAQAQVPIAVLIGKLAQTGQYEPFIERVMALQGDRASATSSLVEALNHPQVPAKVRARIGDTLSEWGDPRPGVSVKQSSMGNLQVPDMVWCDIPAGTYRLGHTGDSNNKPYTFQTDGFKMARYPVTYQQFQCFVDAPDFEDPTWWKDMPEKYTGRKDLREQAFKYWNHPRESVSWYQAVAFTRWLNHHLKGSVVGEWIIGETCEIRLPYKREWEAGARGTDGRIYPYGGSYDPNKGNTDNTGIGKTSAVGCFPLGASPFGVLDMSGNVWEWCLNEYKNPDEYINYGNEKLRALRGGSLFLPCALCACRRPPRHDPDRRFDYHGFRLVCVPLLNR